MTLNSDLSLLIHCNKARRIVQELSAEDNA